MKLNDDNNNNNTPCNACFGRIDLTRLNDVIEIVLVDFDYFVIF